MLRVRAGTDAANYGGALVPGAWVMGLFGDAVTELCIREGGEEGLFASYESVTFAAPIYAGDYISVRAVVAQRGRRSRKVELIAEKEIAALEPGTGSRAAVLNPPLVVCTAIGVAVLSDTREGEA